MGKSKRQIELYQWLDNNHIEYNIIDTEVVDIPDFGKAYYQDTEKSTYYSIFRKNHDGELVFNSMESPEVLLSEGINYIVFKFGDNYYYYDLRKKFELNILKYVGNRKPTTNTTPFVNLGVHTAFELLNGSFMPNMWTKKAKYLGHTALGICDCNTMAGCFTLQKACEEVGIAPIFGYSMTVVDEDEKFDVKVYAQSQRGYQNLLRIQKAIMVDNVENKTIPLQELLIRGTGNALVFSALSSQYMVEHKNTVLRLIESFDRSYYQVDLSEYKAERIDIEVLEATRLYFDNRDKFAFLPSPILISDCYYLDKDDFKNKIILNKIAEGAAHRQSDEQYYKDVDEHYQYFKGLFSEKWNVDDIFQECCANTIVIAENAKAHLDTTKNYMPKYDMTEDEQKKYGNTYNMFNQLLEDGLKRLTPKGKEDEYRKRMEYEKYVIESTDNVDYLLVQYDTCNWARRNNILIGSGRGSAAGSLLFYLLGVTLIDPIRYNLLFERFLLPERAGLSSADTTIIGQDLATTDYIELTLENGKTIKVDRDAEFMVWRNGRDTPIQLYADELQADDDVIFDNKDLLFTLNDL